MAKNTTSSILNKYGAALKKAHEAHKGEDTVMGDFSNLPDGIENGIARLTECCFKVYDKADSPLKGEAYFYAAGVVLSPKEHEGVPIQGLQTRIQEPLCDTPERTRKTVADHLGQIYKQLRTLGVDTSTLELEDLEATVAALKDAAPTFRFRTWKGEKATSGKYKDKEPLVNHQWTGLVDFEEEGGDDVEDGTAEVEEAEAPPKVAAKSTSKATPPAATKAKTAPKKEEPKEEAFDEFGDIDGIVLAADNGDDAAKTKLLEMAKANGATDEMVEAAESWEAVAKLATEPLEGEEEAEEEPNEEEFVPEVGALYGYTPVNPRTKKPGTKVEVEILSVDVNKKVAVCKNMVDGKTKYTVPFDAIESAD